LIRNGGATEAARTGKHPFFYGYVIVGLAMLILMTTFGPNSVYGVFFQPLVEEFHWSRTTISGAMALNNIVFGVACIFIARLCDRFSPRLVIGLNGVLLGLGYLFMANTHSAWQLYLSYGLVIGVGMSNYVAALNILTRWFVKRRGLMTGIAFIGTGLSAMIGPPAANWLIDSYDWRQALIILGIGSLVIMVVVAFFLKRDPQSAGQSAYGSVALVHHTGAAAATGLSLREALRTNQFWTICLIYFSILFCSFVFIVHIAIYIIDLGMTPATAADIQAMRGLVPIVLTPLMGVFGDRFGNRRTISLFFLLMAAAFLWLLVTRDTWGLYAFSIALGISNAGTAVLTSPLVAEVFGIKSHGVILGIAALAGTLGGALGPLFAGYIFDQTASYSPAFIACAALALISGITTMTLRANLKHT
jgi:MFS family permease